MILSLLTERDRTAEKSIFMKNEVQTLSLNTLNRHSLHTPFISEYMCDRKACVMFIQTRSVKEQSSILHSSSWLIRVRNVLIVLWVRTLSPAGSAVWGDLIHVALLKEVCYQGEILRTHSLDLYSVYSLCFVPVLEINLPASCFGHHACIPWTSYVWGKQCLGGVDIWDAQQILVFELCANGFTQSVHMCSFQANLPNWSLTIGA